MEEVVVAAVEDELSASNIDAREALLPVLAVEVEVAVAVAAEADVPLASSSIGKSKAAKTGFLPRLTVAVE